MVRIVILKLLESYFRHRWLYFLPIVVMLAIGGFYISTKPTEYTSSGVLYVERDSLLASLTATTSDGNFWISVSQSTINEINELLATRSFVRSVIQHTSLENEMRGGPAQVERTFDKFRKMIEMVSLGEKLVQVNATSNDPELAQQAVNALMESYVQWKLNADYQESLAAQSFFAQLITPYEEDLQRARDELTLYLQDYPEPVRGERPPEELMEIQRLQAEVQRAEVRVEETLKNEESARLALAKSEAITRQTYVAIDAPDAPYESNLSINDIVVNMAIFLAIGLIISGGSVIAAALMNRSFTFAIEIRNQLGLPLIAAVPKAKTRSKAHKQQRHSKTSLESGAKAAPASDRQPQLTAVHNPDTK